MLRPVTAAEHRALRPARVGPFAVNGVPFVIESNRPEMVARLDQVLGDLRAHDSLAVEPVVLEVNRAGPEWAGRPWAVRRDGETRAGSLEPSQVVPFLVWEVTRLLLQSVSAAVPVHASAVALGGRALVLAGHPGSGTSILATALVTRGWGYLADDVTVIDAAGEAPVVRPFWRPLPVPPDGLLPPHVPEGAGDLGLVRASALGALAPTSPLAAVVVPTHAPGLPHDLQPLTPGEVLVALTEHLPVTNGRGRAAFVDLADVASTVPGHSLAYDDLDEAEARLRALLEAAA